MGSPYRFAMFWGSLASESPHSLHLRNSLPCGSSGRPGRKGLLSPVLHVNVAHAQGTCQPDTRAGPGVCEQRQGASVTPLSCRGRC